MYKYQASWSVNNGSTFGKFGSNNKRQAAKDAREIAHGNVFHGNTGSWAVYEWSEDGIGDCVAKGNVR